MLTYGLLSVYALKKMLVNVDALFTMLEVDFDRLIR